MGRAEGGRWNCTALTDAITQEGEIGRTPGGKGSCRGMAMLWLDAGKHRKSYDWTIRRGQMTREMAAFPFGK